MDNIIMLKCDWIRGEAREGVWERERDTQGLFSETPFISSPPLSLSHSLLSWILNEPCCGRLQTEAVGILKHWYRVRNTLPPVTNKSRGCWAFQGRQTHSRALSVTAALSWCESHDWKKHQTSGSAFGNDERGWSPLWCPPPHWKIRFKQSSLTMSRWHWVMPHFQIFSCMKCQKVRLETFSSVSGKCHVLLNSPNSKIPVSATWNGKDVHILENSSLRRS